MKYKDYDIESRKFDIGSFLLIIASIAVVSLVVGIITSDILTARKISDCNSIDSHVSTTVIYDRHLKVCYGYINGSLHHFRLDGDTIVIKEKAVSIRYE